MIKLISAIMFVASAAAAQEGETPYRDFAPSFAPDGTQYVFYSYRQLPDNRASDIFMKRASGEVVNITNSPAVWEIEPDWSPDGERIIFAAGEGMSHLALYVMSPSGGDQKVLLDIEGASSSSPRWSPNGDKVVFVGKAADTGEFSLMLVSDDGSHVVKLLADRPGSRFNPDWSPDGYSIIFVERVDDTTDLYAYNLHSKNIRRVTNNPIETLLPVWAPDGKSIIYSANTASGYHLISVSLDGSEESSEEVIYTAPAGSSIFFKDFSPDGELSFDMGNPEDGYLIYTLSELLTAQEVQEVQEE